jgi:hypothetical protein
MFGKMYVYIWKDVKSSFSTGNRLRKRRYVGGVNPVWAGFALAPVRRRFLVAVLLTQA